MRTEEFFMEIAMETVDTLPMFENRYEDLLEGDIVGLKVVKIGIENSKAVIKLKLCKLGDSK